MFSFLFLVLCYNTATGWQPICSWINIIIIIIIIMFRATMWPSAIVYRWLSGLQTRQPPTHSEKYQCRTDTVSSPDDGPIVARNKYRSWNKYTKK